MTIRPSESSVKPAGASPLRDSKQPDSKQAPGFHGAPPEAPRVPAASLSIAEVTDLVHAATPLPRALARLVAQYHRAPPAPAVLHGRPQIAPITNGARIDMLLSIAEHRPLTVLIGAGGREVPMRIVSKEGAYVTVAIPNREAVALGLIAQPRDGQPAEEVPFVFDLKQGNMQFEMNQTGEESIAALAAARERLVNVPRSSLDRYLMPANGWPRDDSKQGMPQQAAGFRGARPDAPRAPPAPAVLHGRSPMAPSSDGVRIDMLLSIAEHRPLTALIGAGGREIPMRIVSKEGAYVTVAIPNREAVALGLIAQPGDGQPAEDVPFVFDLKQGNLDLLVIPTGPESIAALVAARARYPALFIERGNRAAQPEAGMDLLNRFPQTPPSLLPAGSSPLADSKQEHSQQPAAFHAARPERSHVPAASLSIEQVADEVLAVTSVPKVLAQLVAQYDPTPPAPAVLHGQGLELPAVEGRRIDRLLSMHENRPTTTLIGAGNREIPMRIVSKEDAYVTVAIPNADAVALGILAESKDPRAAQDVQFVFDLRDRNFQFRLNLDSNHVYRAWMLAGR